MIVSASRRTDIPAYYPEWFFKRLQEEYVLVRNPMNAHQVSRISLSPDVVDGLVLWTKNPLPMMGNLSALEKYNFYFQFTITPYDRDVEPNVPSKNQVIIPAFQKLSQTVGKERVVWRYDPIIFNDRYTMEYHCRYFRVLAAKLGVYTEKCTVSFVDLYKNTARNMQPLQAHKETEAMQVELMQRFVEIASGYGFYIDTCAETINLDKIGVKHAHCIDKERLERLGQCRLSVGKDQNQRAECGCVSSIDIGAYNTCRHGCLYCYANFNGNVVHQNAQKHNPSSPLLFGELGEDDIVKDRKMVSYRDCQVSMFI